MTTDPSTSTTIRYILQFGASDRETFSITIDKLTGKFISPPIENAPEWTKLAFEQCPNCPLDTTDTEYCPTAIGLSNIAGRFGNILSHSEVELVVIFDERWVGKRTTSQEAISSLMGLQIATSGCPHTDYLKPMARFHLPLATADETLIRTTGSYFLRQYYDSKVDGSFDFNLSGLAELYSEMQIVNASIAKRLRASEEFSELNALTILDTFAQVIPIQIEDNLDDVRPLFSYSENAPKDSI